MERKVVGFVLLVLFFGSFALAEESSGAWDDFSDGERSVVPPSGNSTPQNNSPFEQTIEDDEDPVFTVASQESGETSYTKDFYQALLVGVGALVFLILFLYLFFRRPNNKWKRKYS